MQDPFATCPHTPVIQLGEIGSTNVEALRIGANGNVGPLWILADRQTAGRGRIGRQWFSLSGNLHASLLLTLWCEAEEITQISLLAGSALADAINAVATPASRSAGSPPILKWPNDLLIENAKCAGILVETTALTNGSYRGVLGFGVNIDKAPDIAGRPSTSLRENGIHTTPSALCAKLDQAARAAFKTLAANEGFKQLKQGWLSQSMPLGSPLTVTTGREVCRGEFAGLDDDGALLLKTDAEKLRRITFGDVSTIGDDE